jgi:hypothetical protein
VNDPHCAGPWQTTSCLCLCHYLKAPCDDKRCEAVNAAARPKP